MCRKYLIPGVQESSKSMVPGTTLTKLEKMGRENLVIPVGLNGVKQPQVNQGASIVGSIG